MAHILATGDQNQERVLDWPDCTWVRLRIAPHPWLGFKYITFHMLATILFFRVFSRHFIFKILTCHPHIPLQKLFVSSCCANGEIFCYIRTKLSGWSSFRCKIELKTRWKMWLKAAKFLNTLASILFLFLVLQSYVITKIFSFMLP